jgi:hypothetical protein
VPIVLAVWEAEIRRIMVEGQTRHKVNKTPTSKITRGNWTGGEAQAVELLLGKC